MGKIDFGNAFSKGWQGFTANIGVFFAGALLTAIISITIILAPVMWAGFLHMCLKSVRGEKVEVGDVFVGFSDFGRYFVGGLLMLAVTLAGLLACCIGVVVTSGITLFFVLHMVDKGKSAGEALSDCWAYFKSDWLMAILLALLTGLIANVFFPLTMPFAWCVVAAAYYDVFGGDSAPAMAQPAAPVEP
jgi:uncharacterized membrane protein